MKYCAFLRGVNVKGTTMKMAEVCKVFEDAGMDNVSSILASGNIIFTSDRSPIELKTYLEKCICGFFDYDAFLFLRNENEIAEILDNNPFKKSDDFHIYVFVGTSGIDAVLMNEFALSTKAENEHAKIIQGNFYWQVPKGNTLDSTFGKVLGRKNLKDKMTSRNINTFEKILKKFSV